VTSIDLADELVSLLMFVDNKHFVNAVTTGRVKNCNLVPCLILNDCG